MGVAILLMSAIQYYSGILTDRLSGYTEIRVMANAGAAIGPILGAILSVYGFQYIFIMAGI